MYSSTFISKIIYLKVTTISSNMRICNFFCKKKSNKLSYNDVFTIFAQFII